jgi:predicted GNAT superfamily acetyltransferase
MSLAPALRLGHEIQIRTLESQNDFQQAEKVQQETWHYSDRDVVPASIFSVAHNFGGQSLGAFDGKRMVGFALSFGSVERGHAHFHSHMVAVVPEYQNRGLGKSIKLAQRQDALSRGIDQIVWTFDPLQTRNAHFNISLLGGIGKAYLPNLYGHTSSPLHGGIPTDRLVVEWNLSSSHVLAALKGQALTRTPDAIDVELPVSAGDPNTPIQERLASQTKLRADLLSLFQDGFAVTGFSLHANKSTYTLQKLRAL